MRSYVFVILSLFLSSFFEVKANECDVTFISKIASNFNGVESLTYEATVEVKSNIPDRKNKKPTIFYINFSNLQSYYKYSFKRTGFINGDDRFDALAWNGEFFQELLPPGILYLKKNRQEFSHHLLYHYNGIFSPYNFFIANYQPENQQKKDDSYFFPFLDVYRDMKIWNALKGKISIEISKKIREHPCSVIKLDGEKDPTLGLNTGETEFLIYLAEDCNYLPIEWSKFAKQERTGYIYRITDIGKIPVSQNSSAYFYFPKKALLEKYFDGDKMPIESFEIIISKIEINKINTEDIENEFLWDPSIASLIFDLDSNTRIRIPR